VLERDGEHRRAARDALADRDHLIERRVRVTRDRNLDNRHRKRRGQSYRGDAATRANGNVRARSFLSARKIPHAKIANTRLRTTNSSWLATVNAITK